MTGHDLTIAKTVNPSYTRTYTWTIDKKVNGEDSAGPISSDQPSVPAHYTVVTTKTGANHGFKLAGTITVTNPNSFAVSGATVTDQAPGGFTCVVQGGGAVGPLAAGASASLSYNCTYTGQAASDHRREPRDGELDVARRSRTIRAATRPPRRPPRTTSRRRR